MSKIALIILDGFGISRIEEGNAVLLAKTPYLDEIISSYPKALLNASGQEVGLSWGEIGNSEVGHTNIGLGRIVLQDLPQIDKSIKDGSIANKPSVLEIKKLISNNSTNLHLMCIFSDGAVHGHINHIIEFIEIFTKSAGENKIYLHLFADGRDSPEKSIEKFIKVISPYVKGNVIIGSLSGRYFAMDRDKNWDRIKLAYDAILGKSDNKYESINEAVKDLYHRKETDEFITPCTLTNYNVDISKDVFLFLNYRSDRAIQLTRAFVDKKFEEFDREGEATNFFTMTTYDDNISAKVLFSNLDLNNPETNSLKNPLAKIISQNGLTQFYVAETEKFAHITYFFAGGEKKPFDKQENKLIESAKVKSHDMYPQMKAAEISKEIVSASKKNYDFICANYANGDMVGHSGNLEACINSIEFLDKHLGTTIKQLVAVGYSIFLTADHGNCDEMIDFRTKKINKEHTLNPVPFFYISPNNAGNYSSKSMFFQSDPIGILSDIAPTIIGEFGINAPDEISGIDLRGSLT